MPDSVSLLLLEFLDWVSRCPRTYSDAMDAWRSSCPRQTVWEDALASGLIEVESSGRRSQAAVRLTPQGVAVLQRTGGNERPLTDERSA
jgi:hypothetical protein